MAVHVDPTAVVNPKAALDDDVSIGPYCVVGPGPHHVGNEAFQSRDDHGECARSSVKTTSFIRTA